MVRTACLVCIISTINGRSKKKANALEDVAQVAGTQQNLSNLYFLDIYELMSQSTIIEYYPNDVPKYYSNVEFEFQNLFKVCLNVIMIIENALNI